MNRNREPREHWSFNNDDPPVLPSGQVDRRSKPFHHPGTGRPQFHPFPPDPDAQQMSCSVVLALVAAGAWAAGQWCW
jgi:hypothetical protein